MTTALATNGTHTLAGAVEAAMVEGDLKQLTPEGRIQHYKAVCESLGLNPFTRPFQYIEFQGKLQLYARREASDQLAALHKVRRTIIAREYDEELYVVTARAEMPDGRVEESIGAITVAGLKGELRANALMKGETKAKRRATLSIVGLGWLDETEVETIRGARYVEVNARGEIGASRPVQQIEAPITREPEPAKGRDSAQDHFMAVAIELGHVTDEGRVSMRKVHAALGVPEEKGALKPWIDRLGWDQLRKLLEDGTTIAEFTETPEPDITAPDDLPFDDGEQAAMPMAEATAVRAASAKGSH